MLAPQVVGLDAVVGRVESMLRRLIGEDIVRSCELSPETGHVLVYPGQLEQVIVNLVINARDAMPQGGTLTLRTDAVELDADACRSRPELAPGRFARLTVRDTGTGMSPEVRERIFEPFFTTKPAGTGTGLGLSTVFGIVKQSCGHIGLESVKGHGTAFEIFLPQLPVPAVCADRPQEAATATSGRELADILCARRPRLPVLLMSGFDEDDFVRHGVVTEEVAFLHKPFSLDELARAVRKVLDEARASAQVPATPE